jgi:hypothetical protein
MACPGLDVVACDNKKMRDRACRSWRGTPLVGSAASIKDVASTKSLLFRPSLQPARI